MSKGSLRTNVRRARVAAGGAGLSPLPLKPTTATSGTRSDLACSTEPLAAGGRSSSTREAPGTSGPSSGSSTQRRCAAVASGMATRVI